MVASSKEQAFFTDSIKTSLRTLNLFLTSASQADHSLFLDLDKAGWGLP